MVDIEHPAIAALNNTGYYGDPDPDPVPICPICSAEVDTYLMNAEKEIIGCTECVRAVDAYEHMDEVA